VSFFASEQSYLQTGAGRKKQERLKRHCRSKARLKERKGCCGGELRVNRRAGKESHHQAPEIETGIWFYRGKEKSVRSMVNVGHNETIEERREGERLMNSGPEHADPSLRNSRTKGVR